jgi:hypothetical protein
VAPLASKGFLAHRTVWEPFWRARATEESVAALVDAAPPLSVAQRDKLAVILRGRAAATGVAYADAYAGKRQRAG